MSDNLDKLYGALQPPAHIKDFERDPSGAAVCLRPQSLTSLSPAVLAGLRQDVIYLWVVDRHGDVMIAIEELLDGTPRKPGSAERALGHPTLVDGGQARIAGELHWSASEGVWKLTNKSGRYGRRPDAGVLLANVAEIFQRQGRVVNPEVVITWP